MTGPWTQHCWHRTTRYIAAPTTVARTWKEASTTYHHHRTTTATAQSSILSIVLQPQAQQPGRGHHPSVLTMDWAVASHPMAPAAPLKRLIVEQQQRQKNTTGSRRISLSSATLDAFVHTWNSHRVGGAIVAWPVTEQGRCGAQCGRVLFVLDQCMEAVLLEQQTRSKDGGLLSNTRTAAPMCCLQRIPTTENNNNNNTTMIGAGPIPNQHPRDDAWGRNVAYSQGPPAGTKRHVVGSVATAHPVSATALWQSFQRKHYHDRSATKTMARCVPAPVRPSSSRGNLLQKIYRC